jgi:hypothetical protein
MDDVTLGFALIGAMVALILLGLPIGLSLISTGAVGVWLIRDNPTSPSASPRWRPIPASRTISSPPSRCSC